MEVGVCVYAYNSASNLKGAVGIGKIGDSKSDTWITQEIAVFLPFFVKSEKQVGSIPEEPDSAHLWLSLWSKRRHIGQRWRL